MPLRDGDPPRIGRFRLSARLGAGGMGVVYLGTAKDGTQAAVKVLRPELADDPEFLIRFRREVEVLTRVDGVCTVRVLDADTKSAMPFLATEYVDGPSLAEYVGQHGPLAPDMLQGLAVGLAEALAAIHAVGVIHRDLKPANVLLTQSGPKVIDFGIAHARDATLLTKAGTTIGSPGFMAPEQIVGRAEPPADIFVWGLTVAFAATGKSPFGDGPTDAVLYRIIHEPPDISDVQGQLRPVVERALAKEPAARPTAGELVALAASPIVTSDENAAVTTRTVLARTWHPPTVGGLPMAQLRRRPGRWLPALAVAAVVATAGGVTAALLTGRPHGAPSGIAAGRTPTVHHPPVSTGSAPASAIAKASQAAATPTVSRTATPSATVSHEIRPAAKSTPPSTYNTGRQVSVVSLVTGGVSGHKGPANSYAAGPTHPANSALWIVCYVNGQSISGPYGTETAWDLGDDGYYYPDAWLYTGANNTVVPLCSLKNVTALSQALGTDSGHTGPSNAYPVGPAHPAGATIQIACYVGGQSITGPYGTETIWDLSTDGYYYSDAWLYTGTNAAAVPRC